MAKRDDVQEYVKAWIAASKVFDRIWNGLSQAGSCDEIGGAEYHRVKQLWETTGCTRAIAAFIVEQANRMPSS